DKLLHLQESIALLARNTRALQESVMGVRLLPVSNLFQRAPRLLRDTARALGKQVELVMKGEDTELDKAVIEALSDPLTHLL
ncbi:chemotaxis protein CheA, partial [Listeria monocytogenes]|nr:chemotaxis protein CheA [Listeria monocytogenes]